MPAATIQKWMETVDEATRQQQTQEMMQKWEQWMTEHAAQIVDKGLPLGKTKRITSAGIADTKNELNFYIVVQAESHEAAAQLLQTHPQIAIIPNTYIEVMDANRPGM